MTARQRRASRRAKRGAGPWLLATAVLSMVIAIGVLSVGIWALNVADEAPALDEIDPIDKGQNSRVFAADGTLLGVISSDIVREPVGLRRIPGHVRQAHIAIEDGGFHDHGGVDWSAVVRAAVENFREGQVVQGGSTITQQLVKNLYTGQLDDRDFEAKIQEAKLATELERRLSKRQILERYLNSASYGTNGGRTAVGIDAAARQYFSKPASDLTLREGALLAGLPQAPSLHNPLLNRKAAKQRRNQVLRAMADQGYISHKRARRVSERNLGVNPGDRYERVREPYVFDYVTDQLIDKYGPEKVRQGGLKVHTTIDLELQEAARDAIAGRLGAPDDPASAVVTIDPRNGNVLAMASSANYDERKFNLAAQGHRQPGSAFKTMVLAAAVKEGADPDKVSYTSRSPMVINRPEIGRWEVNTFDKRSGGNMNLRRATVASDNVVFAQLGLDVGPGKVRDTAKQMGITSKLNAYPAESIGGLEKGVTPLEMANAYGTLAAGGVRERARVIRRVEFPDGEVDRIGRGKPRRAFSDGVAGKVTGVLSDNMKRGTGTAADIGCPAAGKTGTTDNFRDAWFVGYTPRLATAVWVGYPDEQRSMTSVRGRQVAGGTFPAEIWGDYMNVAKRDFCGRFPRPSKPFRAGGFSPSRSSSSSGSSSSSSSSSSESASSAPAPTAASGGSGSGTGSSPSRTAATAGDGDSSPSSAYAPGIHRERDIPGNRGRGGGNGRG